jgi:hypothetical protein
LLRRDVALRRFDVPVRSTDSLCGSSDQPVSIAEACVREFRRPLHVAGRPLSCTELLLRTIDRLLLGSDEPFRRSSPALLHPDALLRRHK